MMMDQELFQTIKRYHTATLSQEETKAFEERLAQDADFQQEVAMYETVYQTVQRYGDQVLEADLMNLGKTLLAKENHNTDTSNQPGKVRAFRPWYFVAMAAALALLLLVFLPNVLQQPATSGELYQEYFAMLESPAGVRGTDSNRRIAQQHWQAAIKAYQVPAYEEAIEKFHLAIQDSAFIKKSEAWLYIGICQLAIEQPEEAMEALVQVSDTSAYFDQAKWYKALTHLRLDQRAQARELLQGIADDSRHENQTKAQDMLDRLEE